MSLKERIYGTAAPAGDDPSAKQRDGDGRTDSPEPVKHKVITGGAVLYVPLSNEDGEK